MGRKCSQTDLTVAVALKVVAAEMVALNQNCCGRNGNDDDHAVDDDNGDAVDNDGNEDDDGPWSGRRWCFEWPKMVRS